MVENEATRQAHLEQLREEVKNVQNPLHKEIDTCMYLINICNTPRTLR